MSSEASIDAHSDALASREGKQNGHVAARSGDSISNSESRADGSSPVSHASGGNGSAALECSVQDGNSPLYHRGTSSSATESSSSDSESDSDVSPEDALEMLQHDPRTVQLIQWSRVFAEPLRLRPFAAEELEEALMRPEEHRVFLSELVWKLLRKVGGDRYHADDHGEEAWSGGLNRRELFSFRPLQNIDFFALSPMKRMRLLYKLVVWRTDECPLIREFAKKADATESASAALRSTLVGEDAKGWQYVAFGSGSEDARLYRQLPPGAPKGKGSRPPDDDEAEEDVPCEIVSSNLEELEDLIGRMEKSRSKVDKKLGAALSKQLLAAYAESAGVRKRAADRAAALEAAPKKRSSRLQVLQQQQRVEQAALAAMASRHDERASKAELDRKAEEKERRTLRAAQYNEAREAAAAAYRRSVSGLKEGPSRQQRMAQRAALNPSPSPHDNGENGYGEDTSSRPRKRRKCTAGGGHISQDTPQEQQQQPNQSTLSPSGEEVVEGTIPQRTDRNGRPRRATAGRRQTQSLADQQALAAAGAHLCKPQRHGGHHSRQSPETAAAEAEAEAEEAAAAAREEAKERSALRAQAAREAALEERMLLARPYRTVAAPQVPKGFEPTRSTRSGRAGFDDKPNLSPAAVASSKTAASQLPPVPTTTPPHLQLTAGGGSSGNGGPHTTLPQSAVEAVVTPEASGPLLASPAAAPSASASGVTRSKAAQPHIAVSAASKQPPACRPSPIGAALQTDEAAPAAELQPDSWTPGDVLMAVQSRSAAVHKPRINLSAITAGVTAAVNTHSAWGDMPGRHPHHRDSHTEASDPQDAQTAAPGQPLLLSSVHSVSGHPGQRRRHSPDQQEDAEAGDDANFDPFEPEEANGTKRHQRRSRGAPTASRTSTHHHRHHLPQPTHLTTSPSDEENGVGANHHEEAGPQGQQQQQLRSEDGALQQRAELQMVLSQLAPQQQQHVLALPPEQQVQALLQFMRHTAATQQAAQSRVWASLPPEHQAALQAMPRQHQDTARQQLLLQRYQAEMFQQQRQEQTREQQQQQQQQQQLHSNQAHHEPLLQSLMPPHLHQQERQQYCHHQQAGKPLEQRQGDLQNYHHQWQQQMHLGDSLVPSHHKQKTLSNLPSHSVERPLGECQNDHPVH